MGISQNGVSYLRTYMIDEQAEHIAEVLQEARRRNATLIEPTAQAQQEWQEVIAGKTLNMKQMQDSCTPGWINNEGKGLTGSGLTDNVYGGGPLEFYDLVRRWREDDYRGLAFSTANDAVPVS